MLFSINSVSVDVLDLGTVLFDPISNTLFIILWYSIQKDP